MSDSIRLRGPSSGDGGGGSGRIHVWSHVLDEIDEHVRVDTTVEQGGVLVGQVDPDTATTVITARIPAIGAVSEVASLTFTHETWEYINGIMDSDYENQKMVGWYHSHPHFGIFLSEYDQFIHNNFFSQPWQVAYVVDPLLDQRGFFAWRDDQLVRVPSWQTWHTEEGVGAGSAPIGTPPPRPPQPNPPPPGPVAPTDVRPEPPDPPGVSRFSLFLLLGLVLALLVGVVIVIDPLSGDESPAFAVESDLAPATARPGEEVPLGTVTVRPGATVPVVSGRFGTQAVTLVTRSQAEEPSRFDVYARVALDATEDDYRGNVWAVGCPESDAGAVCAEPEFVSADTVQLTVETDRSAFAFPPSDRFVAPGSPASAPLPTVPDEVVVVGGAEGALRGTAIGGDEERGILQLGFPGAAGAAEVASAIERQDLEGVLAHRSLVLPIGPSSSVADIAEGLALELDGVPAAGPVTVVDATVEGVDESPGDLAGRRVALCEAIEAECPAMATPEHLRFSGPQTPVSFLALHEDMAAAASEAGVVVVSFPVGRAPDGSCDDDAAADTADLVSPLVAQSPEVLWVIATTADCAQFGIDLAEPPNVLTVGVDADGGTDISVDLGEAGDAGDAAAVVGIVAGHSWVQETADRAAAVASLVECLAEAADLSAALGSCVPAAEAATTTTTPAPPTTESPTTTDAPTTTESPTTTGAPEADGAGGD